MIIKSENGIFFVINLIVFSIGKIGDLKVFPRIQKGAIN